MVECWSSNPSTSRSVCPVVIPYRAAIAIPATAIRIYSQSRRNEATRPDVSLGLHRFDQLVFPSAASQCHHYWLRQKPPSCPRVDIFTAAPQMQQTRAHSVGDGTAHDQPLSPANGIRAGLRRKQALSRQLPHTKQSRVVTSRFSRRGIAVGEA